MLLLLVWLAIMLGAVLLVVAPLATGRWLADREQLRELEERSALEAEALRLLSGCEPAPSAIREHTLASRPQGRSSLRMLLAPEQPQTR